MKNIIFIAPPAAGKGTQSELLCEKYGYTHISTGDLLRGVDPTSELGIEVNNIMKSGSLVSDEIIFRLIEERLGREDVKNGFILDGFPRTINQAKTYEELSNKLGLTDYVVIFINISEEMAMNRALGRLGCPTCGKIYHKTSKQLMPKVAGICDECSADLVSRDDDNEESFKKRFNTYLDNTKPLIDFYTNLGKLVTISADDDKMKIFAEVEKEIVND